jgi:hypothetical protein
MTKEELDAYLNRTTPARMLERHGRPVLDALIEDPCAVGSGQEIELHLEIMKECRRRGWVYVYHDPTKRTGATLGTPDFIIYAAAGRVLNVECKTKTGTLSKDQQNFKRDVEKNGHSYFTVRSLKRFMEIATSNE